jgi:hypothetical protein
VAPAKWDWLHRSQMMRVDYNMHAPRPPRMKMLLGPGFAPVGTFTTTNDWSFGIPHWLVMLLFALLPGYHLLATLRRRQPTAGICAICGYDLRATPDRCPECGTRSGAQTPHEST